MHQSPLAIPNATPAAETDVSRLCPACGYDLRGSAGDQCSECGLVVDRAALDRSGFPWAYCESRGWVSAFLATVWLVTRDAMSLRFEASRRQSPGEAAVFRRWVVTLLGASFVAVVMLMYAGNALEPMLATRGGGPLVPAPTGWRADLHVPWSAGMNILGAPFAYALLVAAYVPAAPAAVFRTRHMPADRADAVRAIGRYLAGPLVWLVPAAGVFVATYLAATRQGSGFMHTPAFVVLTILWCLMAAAALAVTVYRVGQWRARAVHGGYATGLLAMGELLVRWCFGFALAVLLVPWCVGLAWIAVDSFRG